jgi:hypothetical protein
MELRFQIDVGPTGSCGPDAGAGGSVALLVDGAPLACVPLPTRFATAPSAAVMIGGTGGVSPLDAFHVAFDDVAVSF